MFFFQLSTFLGYVIVGMYHCNWAALFCFNVYECGRVHLEIVVTSGD